MGHQASLKCTVGSVLVVLIASLLFGIIIGSTGPSIDTMKNEVINFEGNIMRLPETSEFVVFTNSQASWFSALVAIGALVGAVVGGPIVNASGHKFAIAITCPIYVTSFVIQAQCSNVWFLFASRLLTGISVGINSFTVPTYISEVSPNHLRGLLGACNQLAITLGILLVYFLGATLTVDGGFVFTSENPPRTIGLAPPESFCNWRLLAFINTVPTCLMLILITLIPESPLWFARKGQIDQALIAHRRLRGGFEIYDETKELMYLNAMRTGEKSNPVIPLTPSAIKPIFLCIALVFFQQFSGINAIMFFCTTILRNAKIESANTLSVTIMAEQVIVTALACYLMDKVGRRILLISSAAVMTFASALFGLYFFLQSYGASHITPLVFISVYTYMAAFSLGVGPIPWLLMGEVIPSNIRATGSSIVTAHNWLFAFAVTVGLNSYTNMVGFHGVMWTFAVCCLALTIFATFLVPETRNKSFDEIAAFFGRKYAELPQDVETAKEQNGEVVYASKRQVDIEVPDDVCPSGHIVEIHVETPEDGGGAESGPVIVAEPIPEEDLGKTIELVEGRNVICIQDERTVLINPSENAYVPKGLNEDNNLPNVDETHTMLNNKEMDASCTENNWIGLTERLETLLEKYAKMNTAKGTDTQNEPEAQAHPVHDASTPASNAQQTMRSVVQFQQQVPIRTPQPQTIMYQGVPIHQMPNVYHTVSVPEYVAGANPQVVAPIGHYTSNINRPMAFL